MNSSGDHVAEGHLRGWRLALFFYPFALFAALLIGRWAGLPANRITETAILLAGLVIAFILAVALAKGFPLWTLPGAGVVLFFLSLVTGFSVAIWTQPLWSGGEDGSLWRSLLGGLAQQALYLLPLLLIVAMLLALSPLLRQRVFADWTRLSLLFYGMALPPLIVNDPYQGLEGYWLAGCLLLAGGAWLFLKLPDAGRRLAVLIAAAALSAVVNAYSIYALYPAQTWAVEIGAGARAWEALQPLINMLALLVLMALPAFIPRLPKRRQAGVSAI